MSADLIDEDSVDTEALQAQIDMSMSFAQSLVSSWMEPHKFPTTSRRKNLEQELTDYMKRPPRLGVGAAIPEGMQSRTRETARLRGKLTGSKRSREDVDATPSKSVSDDEGESKVVAIKKKARFDPFDVVQGKKKKKKKDTEATIVKPDMSDSPRKILDTERTDGIERNLNDPDKIEDHLPANKASKSTRTTDATDIIKQNIPPLKVHASLEAPPASPFSPKRGKDTLRTPGEHAPTKTGSRKTLPSDLLKVPLLNLTGPPSGPESDCEPTTSSTSPKKKRRRRKKKNQPVADGLENIPSTNQPPST